jgi:hypothetical protein
MTNEEIEELSKLETIEPMLCNYSVDSTGYKLAFLRGKKEEHDKAQETIGMINSLISSRDKIYFPDLDTFVRFSTFFNQRMQMDDKGYFSLPETTHPAGFCVPRKTMELILIKILEKLKS